MTKRLYIKLLVSLLIIFNLHALGADELVFPPPINLLQYIEPGSNSVSVRQNARLARVWGWSRDGKVVYSVEGGVNSEAGYSIEFVVLDLNTDKVLFNLEMNSRYVNNWAEGNALFNVYRASILNALRTHHIIAQRTEFLPFPFRRNNIVYDAQIIDIEIGEDEYWLLGNLILRYSVLATAGDRRKTLGNFTPFLWLNDVYMCGYFLSPFEDRALVVIAEDLGQYMHGGILYRFVDFHLE